MMYRVKRKRIKTKERIIVAGETFYQEELGIDPGPKLDRLIDRLTRLDQIVEIETAEENTTVVNNATVIKPAVVEDEMPKVSKDLMGEKTTELTLEDLEHKGPWYYLPNGEKVKGREKALEALAALPS